MDVLVADDSEFVRTLLGSVLREEHRLVGEAGNGVEAVELYEETDPDVVLMAVRMPIRDGIEATRDIVEGDPSANVVMCTGVADRRQREDAIRAGASGYVTKPFQGSSVLDEIARVVGD